jgi:hypothetical protein
LDVADVIIVGKIMVRDPFNHDKIWRHTKRYALKSFDFGIKGLIRDLNENQQHTINSCRGHPNNLDVFATSRGDIRVGYKGHVILDPRSYDPKITLKLLKKHRLKHIEKYHLIGGAILYIFDPILRKPL